MLSALTIADRNGVDVPLMSDDGLALVTNAAGLIGVSGVRAITRPRPTAHGGINQSHWTDGQLVVIEGEVASPTSQEDAFARWRAISKPFIETLDYGAALMKWREGSAGNSLQKTVTLYSLPDPVLQGVAPIVPYQAQFYAEDPRAYDQTQTLVTGGTLSAAAGGFQFPFAFPISFATTPQGGLVACINAGNRKTPPILRLYGQVTNPVVTLLGTQSKLTFSGTIAAGTYVEVDVAKRTAVLGGTTTSQLSLINFPSTSWFEIPSGSSTLQMQGTAFDGVARCDVLFRSAYA